MYHKHPPTGWIDWEGPLRPRAFDLGKITIPVKSPWEAVTLLHNEHVSYRYWRTEGAMDTLLPKECDPRHAHKNANHMERYRWDFPACGIGDAGMG